MDRAFWLDLKAHGAAVPEGADLQQLTGELLGYLGSPDPELRDAIGYEVLGAWVAREHYDPDQLRALGDELVARLQVGFGDRDSDTVFGRSFAALLLAEIVNSDNRRGWLDAGTIQRWTQSSLAWFGQERDRRGYLPGKGWAHAVAHGADLFRVLAASRHTGVADLEWLLDAIADNVIAPCDRPYLYGEDDRLAAAVLALVRRDLVTPAFLREWVRGIARPGGRAWHDAYLDPERNHAAHNTKSFLRAVFLTLRADGMLPVSAAELLPAVEAALRTLLERPGPPPAA